MARPFNDKSDDMVMCRAALHAWAWAEKDQEDEAFRSHIPGTVVVWVCTRCESLKYQKFSPVTGNPVTSPTIRYSEGYLLGDEFHNEYSRTELKAESRLELLKRFK